MSGAGYFTPAGLSDLQGYESGGNPTAQNPASTASGLYGFLTSTWQQFAPQAGVDINQYPTAASAPADIQSQVASITPVSNWTCTNCDAGITADIASNPSLVSSTPMTAASSFGADIAGSIAAGDNPYSNIFTGSAAGAPGATAIPGSSQALSGISSWWTEAQLAVENFATRGALIFVGIVLLAAAAFALSRGSDGLPV